MLILQRKLNQSIIVADNIKIKILGIIDNIVSVGIEAPIEIVVDREEIYFRKYFGNNLGRAYKKHVSVSED